MKIFEQNEWHGIARRSPERNDELTSKIEINTEPGEDELRRLKTRVPYLSNALPAPALKFESVGSYLCMYDATGIESRAVSSAEDFEMHVCFYTGDLSLREDAEFSWLFYNVKLKIYLAWNSSSEEWNPKIEFRNDGGDDSLTIDYALKTDTWYWLKIVGTSSDNVYGYLYEDGSDATCATGTAATTGAFENTAGAVYLGGAESVPRESYHDAIAYFIYMDDTSAGTVSLSPWEGVLVDLDSASYSSTCFCFLPRDLRKTIFPCCIGDSANKISWVYLPRPGLTLTTTSDGDQTNVKGPHIAPGKGVKVDLTGKTLFQERTVFMFCIDYDVSSTLHATLLRSEDCLMNIYFEDDLLKVLFRNKEDNAYNLDRLGHLTLIYVTASNLATSNNLKWFAIEFLPYVETLQGQDDHVSLYEWPGASAGWTQQNWDNQTVSELCSGPVAPASTTWFLARNADASMDILDFRVIVGDSDWKTNYPVDEPLTVIPKHLICWLNHDDSGYWPRDMNCKTITRPTEDYVDETVAISDRVDGKFRYIADSLEYCFGWRGCPHLSGYFFPTVEGINVKPNGTAYGTTDGYWFDDTTGYSLAATRQAGLKKPMSVGEHRYVTGSYPMQTAGDNGHVIGIRPPFIRATEAQTETVENQGWLSDDEEYSYKVTIYDTLTGVESNGYGEFKFTPSGISSAETCGYHAITYVDSAQDLNGYQLRYYRYSATDGAYHYEGSANLEPKWSDDWSDAFINGPVEGQAWQAEFIFTLSDTDLIAGEVISEDNDEPPLHTVNTIWAERAWFVDALNPSRIKFSKQYYFGSVPGANVCWTDEGTTGEILGLLPGFGGLLLLKENSIWIIPQTIVTAEFKAQELIPNLGVVGPDAAVFVDGVLWFADNSGVYVYNGQQVEHVSRKLDGLDRNVWDANPRKTRAFYDRENWRVVFACEGTAITFDSRNGSASLCSMPYQCCGHVSSSSYTGPLYGTDGMVWKEHKGSRTLTADSTNYNIANDGGLGPLDINSEISDLTWYWSDGTDTGSERIGIDYESLSAGTGTTFANSATLVGRLLTQWNIDAIEITRDYDIWCSMIHFLLTADQMVFKHLPTDLNKLFIDCMPVYYRSQDIYFQSRQDMKIIELVDMLFGNRIEEDADSSAEIPEITLTISAETIGTGTAINTVTTGSTDVDDNYFLRVPTQRHCFRAWYEYRSYANVTLPSATDLRFHYSLQRPGGGGRR